MKKIGSHLLNMNYFVIFFSFFLGNFGYGQVQLEYSTERPVVGESFEVTFKIQTDSSEEPQIEFTPDGIEVQEKNFNGVSTQTTYINGKLSTTRELMISYQMVAQKAGTISLKEIKVKVGNQMFTPASKNLLAVAEKQKLADVLLLAVPTKRNVYRGEGIYVRYFIYHRIGLSNFNILQYPKLDFFTKRYLQDTKQFTETASHEGEMYHRTMIYAAYVFPDKDGKLVLDPMKISVNFPSGRGSGDPFDLLGFSRGRMVSKTLISPAVTLEVKPLPTNNMPQNFTGLVGEHRFNLDVPRVKVLVNEPMDLKLTVQGPGNLEGLDPPQLLTHPQIEQFDVTSNFEVQGTNAASKSFNYVFLPRANLKFPEQNFSLSYFDPDKQIYVEVPLKLPSLEAGGGTSAPAQSVQPVAAVGSNNETKSLVDPTNEKLNGVVTPQIGLPQKSFVGPYWSWKTPVNYWKISAFSILVLIYILMVTFLLLDYWNYRKWKSVEAVWGSIFSGEINLSQLIAILDHIQKEKKDFTLYERVDALKISNESKLVLRKLIDELQSPYYKSMNSGLLKLDKDQILGLRQLREYNNNEGQTSATSAQFST